MALRPGLLRIKLESMWKDYAKCSGMESKVNDTRSKGDEKDVNFDSFLEKGLLWAENGNFGNVTKEALVATTTTTSKCV